ncbi:hypothetical protein [Streptomyces griseofuscus]|uniref:hypothetical protein n=1 Tax=Streptomyces griseofuscus TaxID=146922 RepID=UPI00118C092A|nr:hypothetical protein SRO_7402 [Streptomyces rochei]
MTALARSGALPGDEVFVPHDRPLRDGVAVGETSQFGDDVWRLQPAIHKSSGRNLILNFNRFPVRFRPVAKQLAYAMLSGPLPQGEKHCKVEGVRCASTELRRFLTWLDSQAEPRCQRLATLTGADPLAYQRHLVGPFPNAATQRETCRAKVRLFWRWRHNLSDWLPFCPIHIDGWGGPDAGAQRRGENRTSRIPEQVLGPLLVRALRFIDLFRPDIIAADQQWRKTRFIGVYQRLPVRKFHRSTGTVHQAISDHLETYVTSGRPLPGWRGVPNRKVLSAVRSTAGPGPATSSRTPSSPTASPAPRRPHDPPRRLPLRIPSPGRHWKKFGMSNATFRRHFPDIAQEIAALRSARPTPGAPSEPTRYHRLVARNAKLKRRNREFTETLTLAACHIQRVTLENRKLRGELKAATGVARLASVPGLGHQYSR